MYGEPNLDWETGKIDQYGRGPVCNTRSVISHARECEGKMLARNGRVPVQQQVSQQRNGPVAGKNATRFAGWCEREFPNNVMVRWAAIMVA